MEDSVNPVVGLGLVSLAEMSTKPVLRLGVLCVKNREELWVQWLKGWRSGVQNARRNLNEVSGAVVLVSSSAKGRGLVHSVTLDNICLCFSLPVRRLSVQKLSFCVELAPLISRWIHVKRVQLAGGKMVAVV